MIDLETLGTRPGSVIWSIGAVKFDPLADDLIDTFYVVLNVKDAQARGLTIDVDAMLWWMDPSRNVARSRLMAAPAVDVWEALDGFAQWFGPDSLPTWSYGATSDIVLLRAAFEKVGLECPWRYWHDRCYRTVNALAGMPLADRTPTHHDTLSDAITQARHLQAICRSAGLVFDA